jgi:trehalose/maltose transport system substrate-binding protein
VAVRSRGGVFAGALAVLVLGLAGGLSPLPAAAERLTISCGRFPAEHSLCREAARQWAEANGHEVRMVAPPAVADDRLALYEELLGVGARQLDVLEIDVVWPGLLAEHLLDLGPALGEESDRFFPSLIANNTVDGRLVALPWFLDLGLLFYRRDLLQAAGLAVPDTWRQLEDAAVILQDTHRAKGDRRFWGFIWQGWSYEGLTCNVMEWLGSWGGGRIVNAAGKVTVDNPRAEYALKRAGDWLGIISPPSVLMQTERESLDQFMNGQAAFMRNWPYVWAELNAPQSPMHGKVGVALLPRGRLDDPHPATLGGWQLAVSRYSEHPQLAADLVRYLTSPEVQRKRLLAGGYIPTRPALLEEPALRETEPFLELLTRPDLALVARPSTVTGADYAAVSKRAQRAVFRMLDDQASVEAALPALAADLEQLSEEGSAW